MEAIALRDGKVYGFVQSPARNPATLSNGALNGMKNIRVVELDPRTLQTRQFLYIMDNPASQDPATDTIADKIGDAAATPEGFLVVERDDDNVPADDPAVITKKVYSFSLAGATDVTGLDGLRANGKSIDQMTASELAAVNVKPIAKTLDVDLAKAGYGGVQKVEGLALLDDGRLAVVNDNDFQVAGSTLEIVGGVATGRYVLPAGYVPEVTTVGLIERPGLDASDKDKLINIRPWPVLGMYEPDAIASYRVDGRSYFVTANEGDAREWPQPGAPDDTYAEESRIKDLTLDPGAFPNAAELQKDKNLGRLNVTTTLGDIDGDGDYDRLYALGARSFSIRDGETGELVFDSGSQLERITAAALPDVFNAGHEAGDVSFDNRSDNKGPEPEALAIGRIEGRSYAFVGLERVGGIGAWDITDPAAPVFLDYVNNRTFTNDGAEGGDVGPEGLLFITAHDSPNRQPLLVVTSEISGNVSTYALDSGRPWKRRFGWWSWWKPRHGHGGSHR
jgi:hypothetical protein